MLPLGILTSIVTLRKKQTTPAYCFCVETWATCRFLWHMEDVALQTQKALDCSQVLTSLHTYSKYCIFPWVIQTALFIYTANGFLYIFLVCQCLDVFFTMKSLWYSQIFTFFYHICKAEISFRSPWKSFCSDLVCCNGKWKINLLTLTVSMDM